MLLHIKIFKHQHVGNPLYYTHKNTSIDEDLRLKFKGRDMYLWAEVTSLHWCICRVLNSSVGEKV